MIYVFDSGPLIDMFHYYYPERFPTLWRNFNDLIKGKKVISVREVSKELEDYGDSLSDWVKENREFFPTPTIDESKFVAGIFQIVHFQTMVVKKEQLRGKPVADPFVIAKASVLRGCVVTKEKYKANAAQIPNVCKHYKIPCIDLEGFMERENWIF